jgi:3-hydroxyisobutyrate dehydrogenase-like beta-hydroxyacid dehydrogenase
MLKVGYVGLGNIGRPMAQRILAAGYPLSLYARRPETLEPFRGSSASIVPTLRELGSRSEVLFICVVDDAQVEEVLLNNNILAGMTSGGIVVIQSTVHPETCRKMAREGAKNQVTVLDAPISGGGGGAAEGKLTVMVGGDPQAFQRCIPIMQTFGSHIYYLGPVGAGSTAKIINNMVYTGNLFLARQALELGQRAGLDVQALFTLMKTGSGSSFALSSARSAAPSRLLIKDITHAKSVADELGFTVQGLDGVLQWLLSFGSAPPPQPSAQQQ